MTFIPKNVCIIRANGSNLADIMHVLEVCELDSREMIPENFFIATVDEKVIGCIRHKIHDENTVEICSLGVLPDFRSKGIGKALLSKKLNELIQKNIQPVYVVTVDDRIFVPFGFKHDSNPKMAIKNKIQWCEKHLPVDKEYFAMKYE
jgi:N-acetylglutamate synthase-like GNAT family acetyltransferase